VPVVVTRSTAPGATPSPTTGCPPRRPGPSTPPGSPTSPSSPHRLARRRALVEVGHHNGGGSIIGRDAGSVGW